MKENNYKYILNANGKALKGVNILGHEITLMSSGTDIVECLELAQCYINVLNDSNEVDELIEYVLKGGQVILNISDGNIEYWNGILIDENLELADDKKPYQLTMMSKDGIRGLNNKLK